MRRSSRHQKPRTRTRLINIPRSALASSLSTQGDPSAELAITPTAKRYLSSAMLRPVTKSARYSFTLSPKASSLSVAQREDRDDQG